ncbi:MAG: hypothetical protein GX818_05610 [Tissierellia bacterium]|nr:hypothetical protein [Tissierellia bacterium]
MDIKKGMPFNIMDDGIIKELTINRIYPKAQAKISDLGVEQKRVRIEADLDDLSLRISSETDVEIVLQEKTDLLLVDKDAIYEKEHKKYVTLISGSNEVESEITTGLEDDNNVEVLTGLKENDLVLID